MMLLKQLVTLKDYKAEYADKDKEERPKVLFVVDPLGMLLTPTDVDSFPRKVI